VMTADEATLEMLGHMQARLEDLRELHDLLAAGAAEPASLSTVTLSVSAPVKELLAQTQAETLSIGVLNPTSVNVFLGLGGGSATAAAEAVSVPPVSLLVLPVPVAQVEIGVDAAALQAAGGGDATTTATVFVLRFPSVQPAFLGKGS
jgi:hypothetical protein